MGGRLVVWLIGLVGSCCCCCFYFAMALLLKTVFMHSSFLINNSTAFALSTNDSYILKKMNLAGIDAQLNNTDQRALHEMEMLVDDAFYEVLATFTVKQAHNYYLCYRLTSRDMSWCAVIFCISMTFVCLVASYSTECMDMSLFSLFCFVLCCFALLCLAFLLLLVLLLFLFVLL